VQCTSWSCCLKPLQNLTSALSSAVHSLITSFCISGMTHLCCRCGSMDCHGARSLKFTGVSLILAWVWESFKSFHGFPITWVDLVHYKCFQSEPYNIMLLPRTYISTLHVGSEYISMRTVDLHARSLLMFVDTYWSSRLVIQVTWCHFFAFSPPSIQVLRVIFSAH